MPRLQELLIMDKISRQQVLDMGGAADAKFVIIDSQGDLYCCVNAKLTEDDHDFWRAGGYTLKEVTP